MLASLQTDTERFRRAYISALRAIAFVTFPMMAGLAMTAYPFIVVVFGQRWAEAAPLLEILAWVGLFQSLTNPTGLIFLATGDTVRMLKWGLVGSSACVLALVIGALLGSAKSVATAYLVINVLLTYPCIVFAGAPVGLRFGQVMAAVAHTVIATGLMAISVGCVDGFFTSQLPVLERLVMDVLLGIGIYSGVSFAARNPALADFKRFVRVERSST
jgi:PST family polysaccharide transporter